jgi:hypothetical protein
MVALASRGHNLRGLRPREDFSTTRAIAETRRGGRTLKGFQHLLVGQRATTATLAGPALDLGRHALVHVNHGLGEEPNLPAQLQQHPHTPYTQGKDASNKSSEALEKQLIHR